jgi:hypothetical protein
MKTDPGMKIAAALWGMFSVIFCYLFVLDTIRKHGGLLRWLALALFLSIFIVLFFVMAYIIFIKDRK